MADNNFVGLAYPILPQPRGYFAPTAGAIQIQSSLLSILMTNKFERVMENDFGSGLDDLLFELSTGAVAQTARDRILQQIAEYEPRVTIDELTVTTTTPANNLLSPGDTGDNVLYIRIKYFDPQNITEIQDLNLEIPIGGNSNVGSI